MHDISGETPRDGELVLFRESTEYAGLGKASFQSIPVVFGLRAQRQEFAQSSFIACFGGRGILVGISEQINVVMG